MEAVELCLGRCRIIYHAAFAHLDLSGLHRRLILLGLSGLHHPPHTRARRRCTRLCLHPLGGPAVQWVEYDRAWHQAGMKDN